MKKVTLKSLIFVGLTALVLSSCTSINKSMREPYAKVDFVKSDFTFSEQLSAQATSTKILGIDFERLFMKKTGSIGGGEIFGIYYIIGNIISDKTANYALYNLMEENKGYDVIFYPQYETKVDRPLGIGFLFKITTVKTTARLAKIK
ncbi:MAG: hypothetical protein SNJ71_02735 [Bacteroidales bacterium]